MARPPTVREATAAAQRLEPDLILLDVHLPDIDGFEIAARIAALGLRSARGFIPKEELSGGKLAGLVPP